MQRRTVLKLIGGGAAVTALGGGAWLALPRDHPHLALDRAMDRLQALDLSRVAHTGAWEAARIFGHLRQGVEFSLRGDPEQKSPLFQSTVGKLAFNLFHARGAMSHALDEVIPGEQVVRAQTVDAAVARDALVASLAAFQDHTGALHPHFAFGSLSKAQYAAAHVLHVNNHLEELKVG